MSVFHHSNRESERMNYLLETGRQKFLELCVVSDIKNLPPKRTMACPVCCGVWPAYLLWFLRPRLW